MLNSDTQSKDPGPAEVTEAGPGRTMGVVIGLLLASLMIWLALVVLAPYLRSVGSPWNSLVYAVFAPTCHQIDSRCLHIFGFPMAVCARCLGIYLGMLCGICLFPRMGPRPLKLPGARTFAVFTLPIALDTAGNMLSLWSTPPAMRLGLGISWGVILPFYLIPGLADLLSSSPRSFRLK